MYIAIARASKSNYNTHKVSSNTNDYHMLASNHEISCQVVDCNYTCIDIDLTARQAKLIENKTIPPEKRNPTSISW